MKPVRMPERARQRMQIVATVCSVAGCAVLLTASHAPWLWQRYQTKVALRGTFTKRPATPTAARIVAGAKQQQGTVYDATYVVISYPNGDVPPTQGACTDVVVRALRNAGYDLQRLMHEDMERDFNAYPHQWGLPKPDANIDHRRVPNQMRFFARHGQTLTTTVSPSTLPQWQPGDFVYWDIGGKQHTGVLADDCNRAGIPLVIHNGYVCVEQDCLTAWKIIGHYRYPPAPVAHTGRSMPGETGRGH